MSQIKSQSHSPACRAVADVAHCICPHLQPPTIPATNTGPVLMMPDDHRKGCSFGRTARCNCTYLAQWDKTPEYTAPTFRVESAAEFLASGPRTLEEALTQDDSVLRAENHHPGAAPFPMPEADYYPQLEKKISKLTVDGKIWEPRCTKPHASYPEWLPPVLYFGGFLIGLIGGYGWGSGAWNG